MDIAEAHETLQKGKWQKDEGGNFHTRLPETADEAVAIGEIKKAFETLQWKEGQDYKSTLGIDDTITQLKILSKRANNLISELTTPPQQQPVAEAIASPPPPPSDEIKRAAAIQNLSQEPLFYHAIDEHKLIVRKPTEVVLRSLEVLGVEVQEEKRSASPVIKGEENLEKLAKAGVPFPAAEMYGYKKGWAKSV